MWNHGCGVLYREHVQRRADVHGGHVRCAHDVRCGGSTVLYRRDGVRIGSRVQFGELCGHGDLRQRGPAVLHHGGLGALRDGAYVHDGNVRGGGGVWCSDAGVL